MRLPRFVLAAGIVVAATLGVGAVEAGGFYQIVNAPKVRVVTRNDDQKVNCGKLPVGSRNYVAQKRGGRWIINGRFYGLALTENSCILVNPNY